MPLKRWAPAILVTVVAVGATTVDAGAAVPLQTAVFEPGYAGDDDGLAPDRVRVAGATAMRLSASWSSVAPPGFSRPDGFRPADPSSASYRWSSLEQQVIGVTSSGLKPILSIVDSPEWATMAPAPGMEKTLPAPVELGKFALAAARRYSGAYNGLPRVRYWQVWNEPNISLFFRPQFLKGQPFSPDWYRRMVNEVATAVKLVHPDNLVVAGGTAPFRDITPEVRRVNPQWGPLTFMRELLCLSKSLKPKCQGIPGPFGTSRNVEHQLDDYEPGDSERSDLPTRGRRSDHAVRRGTAWRTGDARDRRRRRLHPVGATTTRLVRDPPLGGYRAAYIRRRRRA